MEARGDAGVREAGRPSQSEPESQASSEEVWVKFTREEYEGCSKRPEMPLKGISLMPIKGLDAVSENWPVDRKIQSKNPYFLRGLAVTYFYQSRMSKARELLLKVWEHVKDLDTALMLAECAIVLSKPGEYRPTYYSGQKDEVSKAIWRVCEYVNSCPRITSKLIDEWNDQVKKSGRFMGYAILQYAWYCKVKNSRDRRVLNPRHFAHAVTKKIALNLLELQDKVTTPTLAYGFVCILKEMVKHLSEFSNTRVGVRKHAYVTALCYNAIACLSMQYGSSKCAFNMTCEGAKKMNTNYSGERAERILYGDLNLNKGVAGYAQSQGRNKGYKKNFDEALSVYRSATEKITDSDRKRLIELVEENMRDAEACVH